MKITDVEATIHEIPVDVPLLEDPVAWKIVVVEVDTDTDVTGYGLTALPQVFGIAPFVNREIAPLLEGRNPLETERLWQLLREELNPRDQTGVWSSAVSAIDIALWDINGTHLDEPVWRLLGGARDTVPTYVTFGLLRYDVDQLTQMAEQFVSDGHRRLKMKVGIDDASNPAEDARRINAVREAVDDDVDVMIDANYGFALETALELCNRIDASDITWFEEPLYGNDATLLAELRERTRIPLAAGQNEGHRFRHRDLLVGDAIDISQPNVCHVGGYTEARKVAALADSFNRRIANGAGWPHHNMHLHAGVPNGWLVEFHYVAWKIGETIYDDPPAPVDGTVTLPDTPGLGLEPQHDVLDEYEIT